MLWAINVGGNLFLKPPMRLSSSVLSNLLLTTSVTSMMLKTKVISSFSSYFNSKAALIKVDFSSLVHLLSSQGYDFLLPHWSFLLCLLGWPCSSSSPQRTRHSVLSPLSSLCTLTPYTCMVYVCHSNVKWLQISVSHQTSFLNSRFE